MADTWGRTSLNLFKNFTLRVHMFSVSVCWRTGSPVVCLYSVFLSVKVCDCDVGPRAADKEDVCYEC